MLQVTPISQRDPRWSKQLLGFSKTRTIGSDGCVLVSLCVLINYIQGTKLTPPEVNAKLKKANAFWGALMVWQNVPEAFPSLKFIARSRKYFNPTVWSYINVRKTPVLVEGDGKSIGGFIHWVLFVGGQKAMDPWSGKFVSTKTYPPRGYALYQRK